MRRQVRLLEAAPGPANGTRSPYRPYAKLRKVLVRIAFVLADEGQLVVLWVGEFGDASQSAAANLCIGALARSASAGRPWPRMRNKA